MPARLQALGSVGLFVLLLTAGCLAGTSPVDDGASNAPADPAPIGPCPDGVERVDVEEVGGDLPAAAENFQLTANRTDLQRGETVRISLRNIDDERHYTGTRHRYVVQRRGPDGWRTVVGWEDGRGGWNATAVSHEPGSSWTWNLTAAEGAVTGDRYRLCGSLPAGTYRFVFLGVVEYSSSGEVTQPPIAVEFRLRDGA